MIYEYQVRVINEKNALDDKICSLRIFVNSQMCSALPVEEQSRLVKQLHYMDDYSRILNERIMAFVTC